MILAIDFRTDIPAFYSEWVINRFREGFLFTRNPAYPKKIHKIILDNEHIEGIIWTSKNYQPIISELDGITNKFPSIFHYTITGYGKDIEPGVSDILDSLHTFQKLSIKYGSNKVIWRYDPVFYYDDIDYNWHIRNFRYLAEQLNGYCDTCVINFVSLYEKTKRHMPGINGMTNEQKEDLIRSFQEILNDTPNNTIEIQMCANGLNCKDIPGIKQSSCVGTQALALMNVYPKGKHNACGCYPTTAIGEYNTCLHKCQYCYASSDFDKCDENFAKHDPKSPLLIGWPDYTDEIVEMQPKKINTGQQILDL